MRYDSTCSTKLWISNAFWKKCFVNLVQNLMQKIVTVLKISHGEKQESVKQKAEVFEKLRRMLSK